jgi:uncharacterized protein YxjI
MIYHQQKDRTAFFEVKKIAMIKGHVRASAVLLVLGLSTPSSAFECSNVGRLAAFGLGTYCRHSPAVGHGEVDFNGGDRHLRVEEPHCGQGVKSTSLKMNFLSDIGNMLSGGNLTPQSCIAHETPFCDPLMADNDNIQSFAIQERPLSFTGEDFDVYREGEDGAVLRVRGAMLHLPGKDKMRIKGKYGEVLVLDRKLITTTPTYDIYYGNDSTADNKRGSKMGWIEKERIALTDTFNVYMEGKGGFGPIRPPPSYRLTGDFIDRNFSMVNDENEVVAKVCKDGLFQFWDSMNHYQVQVASGMDPALVVACACAIDEEFDEEHQKRKKKIEEAA